LMTTIEAHPMDVPAQSGHLDTGKPVAPKSERRSGQRHLPDIVTRDEAGRAVSAPERLANVAGDTMTLHTSEALRLFVGQGGDVRWRVEPLVGGKHFASALKEIWFLSGRDHPYADWMLIRAYDELATLRARIAGVTQAWQGRLDAIRRRGLSMGVMESSRPVSVSLGFRSPYGYAAAAAIVEFDHYVRLVHTLVRKDQLDPAEGRNEILVLCNSYFALFRKSMQWKRLLLHEDVKAMTRKDFRPDADDEACQRVRAAVGYFGSLPHSVLLREDVPRHARLVRTDPLPALPDKPDDSFMRDVFEAAQGVKSDGHSQQQQQSIAAPDVSRGTLTTWLADEHDTAKAGTL